MSLNTSHTLDGKGVLIYNGEVILVYAKEVCLEFDRVSSGEVALNGKKKGQLYLTSHRLIFVNKDLKDRLLSMSMPFSCIRDVKLEQPVFGANYLHGFVTSQPGGNWVGEAGFKLTFNSGGCIEFGEAMLRAGHLAAQIHVFAAPPPYVSPGEGYFQPPPAYYIPPQGNYYGFAPPTQAFPDYPTDGSVYMYNAPPPYPGIGPQQQQMSNPMGYPQVQNTGQNQNGVYSKEAEAMTNERPTLPTYDEVRKNK